ncbi:indole-3-acetaldehyde oxidase-like [Teleopsis dalmanni]|uniref:indole-3-acetaldehyde oxidase-like n=1 Tax=Teleopsis dalmanni TaxID=139649 RepID=UPI0018CE8A63|nr:indole-3-acetaldehyde oxidase-like [Teleopsis dalmanni]
MTTTFKINGINHTVNLSNLPADITLNTFIREHAGLTATKFMCQEGGCGVCVCAVTGKHPGTGEVHTWAVNSCLTLLNTCADLEITTSEGLGNKREGYHAIQQRLAKMNGTQCGYCSPGFVMNMYALLQSKNGTVTMEEVENSFGGNICRCTGYRPILDAMKSFAVDSNIEVPAECQDIEDLKTKTCPKTGGRCSGTCNGVKKPLSYEDGSQWFWPKSIADIFNAFQQLEEQKYILVAGNTAHGVYRRDNNIKAYIDVNGVAELKTYTLNNDSLTLGGNLSLTEAMEIFTEAAKTSGFEYCKQLWQHFDWIANVPVRNAGTLAGNFAIKHENKEFPSDIFIVFEALDVKIVVNMTATEQKTLSLVEYLKTPMIKKVITAFILKPYSQDSYIFDSYKIMPRAQNAHAYVNAAFLVEIEKPTYKVHLARICFGGITEDFIHADTIENLLKDKNLFDQNVLNEVFSELHKKLQPNVVLPEPSPAYRKKLAYGLLYKFILQHAPSNAVRKELKSGGSLLHRPVSSGKQSYETLEKSYPVNKPTQKLEGLIQTSGEATYANDLPVQPNQVWAAFVPAKKVGATITNIDTSEAMKLPGVVAFFTAKDIPGKNSFVPLDDFFFPREEELFVADKVMFYNQPVGVLLAESNALANRAAELVKLTYTGGSKEVLPTLKDVLNSENPTNRIEHSVKSIINKLNINDPYDYTATGKLDMGLQYHYCLEPQTTVVVPIEGALEVHTASQWMDLIQMSLSNLLNMKNNEIQVKVRRIGGGYGGKGTRCNPVACAAALAAYKLNRPVRFVQSIESMMDTLGKRWAFQADYEFFVKNTGKIVGIHSTFFEDAGYLPNETPLGHTQLVSKNCYMFSDNFKLDGSMVFTDSPSNSACRAPGSVEGIAMIENILEHIAFETGADPVDVRTENLLPGHKMGQMLPRFVDSTKYKERKNAINIFNTENRWRKKGLGIAIMEYHMGYFGQFPATVAIYHGDGTVVISHGGIEMGQGMNTKIAQVAAYVLGIPVEMIKIEGSNTVNGANSMVTGGSIGSESICFAVRKCCNTLNDRLKAVKEDLKDSDWQGIISEAYNRKVNMIASDDMKQGDMEPYTVCALCLTEVEVDILTGNYLINRVDILEDAGESLNPSVDIGQIEGAFMMGLGYWTTEKIVVDKVTGELKTNRTWNYKPPGAKDIPIDFRVEMLPQSSNPAGFMRSKATGEPAICLAIAVAFALQEALQSARNDAGLKKIWIPLCAPMTPEHIVLNAGTDVSMLKLN